MKRYLMVILVSLLTCAAGAGAADVTTIDKDELKQRLGSTELVILDVRAGGDWDSSEFKIAGAVREDPSAVESWVQNYSPDKTYVLYCS